MDSLAVTSRLIGEFFPKCSNLANVLFVLPVTHSDPNDQADEGYQPDENDNPHDDRQHGANHLPGVLSTEDLRHTLRHAKQ